MLPLSKYSANVTSQNGEDGVLGEIFRRIGTVDRSCIEFGAWDGKHLSNTWKLWHEDSWRAMLIEGDEKRFRVLTEATRSYQQVVAVNRFVAPNGPNSLDNIIRQNHFSNRPDLLSIDIDGDDLAIFEAMQACRPRVVVIEYNATFPAEVSFQQKAGEAIGSSAKAILAVARRKGYKLAHLTDTNLILVTSDEFSHLSIGEPSLPESYPTSHLSPIVMSFDGRPFLLRSRLPHQASPPPYGTWRLFRLLLKSILKRSAVPVENNGLFPVEVMTDVTRRGGKQG
jgi:hypothetical protein